MAYIHVILLDKGTTSTTSSVAFCSMHLIVHPKYAGCEEVFLTGDVEGDETIQGRNAALLATYHNELPEFKRLSYAFLSIGFKVIERLRMESPSDPRYEGNTPWPGTV
ncbi:hypothetical protein HNY73_007897 [Argiope bruennichi]|uniref:Uncharacterized protein n=1 Tax=Argiope bruennichi TaxID=94029 RepID=A0A8T0F4U0_ARGBR|nr:hypothetical protein HNY73_007897 [Argiope bruennichi]